MTNFRTFILGLAASFGLPWLCLIVIPAILCNIVTTTDIQDYLVRFVEGKTSIAEVIEDLCLFRIPPEGAIHAHTSWLAIWHILESK